MTAVLSKLEDSMTSKEFQAAIDEHQFRLVFQPQIDCSTRKLRGFEVLVRWDHPKAGLVMPDTFIPVAEELGMIGAITEQIITMALDWYKNTPKVHGTSISVNISGKSLLDAEFSMWLRDACQNASLPPRRVILEISEAATAHDHVLARVSLGRLRDLGFRVSVDHFGVSQSSLTGISDLPLWEVKVDKSIAMAGGPEAHETIKAIVNEGKSLGLTVVTEGVEDRETLQYLRSIGCNVAQGYYIACPMGGDLVEDWMVAHDEAREQNLL